MGERKWSIALITEGEEEFDYWTRLQNLGLILDHSLLKIINAKSISKIPPKFQDAYVSNRYYLTLVFCDTDEGFQRVKDSIDDWVGLGASKLLLYFASPCSMTVWLAHFSKQRLIITKTVNKKKNGFLLKELGVSFPGDYDAKEVQRAEIMRQITPENYERMKALLGDLPKQEDAVPATNILELLDLLDPDNDEKREELLKELQRIENNQAE